MFPGKSTKPASWWSQWWLITQGISDPGSLKRWCPSFISCLIPPNSRSNMIYTVNDIVIYIYYISITKLSYMSSTATHLNMGQQHPIFSGFPPCWPPMFHGEIEVNGPPTGAITGPERCLAPCLASAASRGPAGLQCCAGRLRGLGGLAARWRPDEATESQREDQGGMGNPRFLEVLPSGKRLHNNGKIHHFCMGKSTINSHFQVRKV